MEQGLLQTATFIGKGKRLRSNRKKKKTNFSHKCKARYLTIGSICYPEDGKVVFTCRQPEPTPTPTVAPSPTEVPDETPAASQEITPAEPTSNTFVDEVRQTPVVTPRVESKCSTPSLTVKKQSKQQILRIVVTDKKAEYFELYVKQKGKRYTKVKLTKKKLKNGKCTIRLSYIKKRQELWFKERTYTKNKGKKKYRAYSKEKKIRV